MHALLPLASLWASAKPELLSGLAVAALLLAGAFAVARLLRDESGPAEEPADPWLRRELQSTWAARAEALAAIRASRGAVRGALEALLADPLNACDERIHTIASALYALSDRRRPPGAEAERHRLAQSLEQESDPRARDLLSASLADLDAVEQARAKVEGRLRLARLELSRLRALLAGIPERVRELESRRVFGAPLGAEDVAAQFAEAVTKTSEDLIEVLALAGPRPTHPSR